MPFSTLIMKFTNLFIILPLIYSYTVQDLQTTVVQQCRKLADNTRSAYEVIRTKGHAYTKKYCYIAIKKTACGINQLRKQAAILYTNAYNKLRGSKGPKEVVQKTREAIPDAEETFDIGEFMKMLEELQRQSKAEMDNEEISGDEGYESTGEEEKDEDKGKETHVEMEEGRQEL